MSNQLSSGQGRDINVFAGQSLAVSSITGAYTATIIAGAGIGTALATASTGGATYGPYSGGVTVRLKAGEGALLDYEAAVNPVLNYAGPARLGYSAAGDTSSVVDGGGNAIRYAETPYIFDVAAVTGLANTSEQILKQYVLPAAFFTTCNYIRLAFLVAKSGTGENMTLRFRLGTAGTVADAQLATNTVPSAASRSNASEYHFFAASATQIRNFGSSPFGGMVGGNASIVPPVNVAVSDMAANAMYLSVTAQMATGAETPTIHHIVLERR